MRTALRVVAIIYAAYLAFALLIVTPALNLVPHWYVEKTWGRPLQTKWVLLNPFKLSLDIREAALFQPDGERFLVNTDLNTGARTPLTLVLNWTEGL